MIEYRSHQWCKLLKVRGSVLLWATLFALPSSILAYMICEFNWPKRLSTESLATPGGTLYCSFTILLGVFVVIRLLLAHSRHCAAAMAVQVMRMGWVEACGSLIAFAQMSSQGEAKIEHFAHTMIRLFGLLHSMALEEIFAMKESRFAALDIEGLDATHTRILASETAEGRKVQIVSRWIKLYVLRSHVSGILPVPSSILTRVFDEVAAGMTRYHEALSIVNSPFPLSDVQLSRFLIIFYALATPLVISFWTTEAWDAAVSTFLSIVFIKGADLLATGMESLFAENADELTSCQIHHVMNCDLTALVHSATWRVPALDTEYRSYDGLKGRNEEDRSALERLLRKRKDASGLASFAAMKARCRKVLRRGCDVERLEPDVGGGRDANLVALDPVEDFASLGKSATTKGRAPSDATLERSGLVRPERASTVAAPSLHELLEQEVEDFTEDKQVDPLVNALSSVWRSFMSELSVSLSEHLSRQEVLFEALRGQALPRPSKLRAASDIGAISAKDAGGDASGRSVSKQSALARGFLGGGGSCYQPDIKGGFCIPQPEAFGGGLASEIGPQLQGGTGGCCHSVQEGLCWQAPYVPSHVHLGAPSEVDCAVGTWQQDAFSGGGRLGFGFGNTLTGGIYGGGSDRFGGGSLGGVGWDPQQQHFHLDGKGGSGARCRQDFPFVDPGKATAFANEASGTACTTYDEDAVAYQALGGAVGAAAAAVAAFIAEAESGLGEAQVEHAAALASRIAEYAAELMDQGTLDRTSRGGSVPAS